MDDEKALREKTAAVMVDWARHRRPPFTGDTPEDIKEAIIAAYLVADESRMELRRWIDAARRSGLSWTDIGDTLGISKQAAQQRFKPAPAENEPSANEGERVVRLGATAFNEMRILREEGENGNELVDTGLLKLILRTSDHRWEYRRRIGGMSMRDEMRSEGWQYVSTWPPFQYFKRRLPEQ